MITRESGLPWRECFVVWNCMYELFIGFQTPRSKIIITDEYEKNSFMCTSWINKAVHSIQTLFGMCMCVCVYKWLFYAYDTKSRHLKKKCCPRLCILNWSCGGALWHMYGYGNNVLHLFSCTFFWGRVIFVSCTCTNVCVLLTSQIL